MILIVTGSADFPQRTSAEIPSRASFRAADPPEFDSLIVPVRGLFPPTERRPLLGREVPAMIPGAKTTTFSGPRGSAFGGTSDATIAEVRPRPPSPEYRCGISSQELFLDVRSTRRIFAIGIPRSRKYSHYDNSRRAPEVERLPPSVADDFFPLATVNLRTAA